MFENVNTVITYCKTSSPDWLPICAQSGLTWKSVKEVNDHANNEHCKLSKRHEVPNDQEVVPSEWHMRHKRNLTTNKITKYKARLIIP